MYRLLIADDEALEREGLEWIIQRMLPNTFHIIHAANGREAIEQAEEHRPHIVMMDVNMPGIQGLAAIKEIKERLPNTKFVLVTAYDYFAYAKEALSLGVKEYLVKPAKRDQIISILNLLIVELEQDSHKRKDELSLRHKVSQLLPLVENELALMFMFDQILDTAAEQLSEWLEFPLDQGCAIVIAFPELIDLHDKHKIYDMVRGFAKAYGISSVVSSLIDRHIAIFLRKSQGASDDLWLEMIAKYGEKILAEAERQLGYNVSIGIGTTRNGANGLRKSYFEAVFASSYYEDNGHVCHFEKLKHSDGRPVSETESPILNAEPMQRTYVITALEHIREERERQTLTVLDHAQNYILDRFTDELSLEEVADFVHLNPHYFSKIFKQQVGITFIDFITTLRIDKAKALMVSEQVSLKEVCFEVGYKDPNYFSRVFKRVTGITPTEYRNQLK